MYIERKFTLMCLIFTSQELEFVVKLFLSLRNLAKNSLIVAQLKWLCTVSFLSNLRRKKDYEKTNEQMESN